MRAKSSYSRELMQKLSGGNIYDVLENKKETLYWGVKKGRVTEINTGDLGRTQGRQEALRMSRSQAVSLLAPGPPSSSEGPSGHHA